MHKRIPIFLGILLTIFALWLLITSKPFIHHLLERLDDIGYDMQLTTRLLAKQSVPTTPIAIIDIDDASLQAEGRWPWPRDKIADLVNELSKQGAAVIAFDILLAEKERNIADAVSQELQAQNKLPGPLADVLKSNNQLFDNDAVLANALKTTNSVLAIGFLRTNQTQNVLPSPILTISPDESKQLNLILAKGYISNVPILQQAAKYGGFVNAYPDTDGILRHAPLLIQYGSGLYPSLSLQAVMQFLSLPIALVTPHYDHSIKLEGVQIGNQIIPTDERGQVLIPFVGKSFTFPYYSATNVLHGKIPPNALFQKILFIGTSATGLGDLKSTAIQNIFPGVEVQATLANGILLNNFSYRPAWTFGANLMLTLFFGLLASIIFPYLGPRAIGVLIVVLPPGLLLLNNWIWVQTGLILSFLMSVLLILAIAVMNIIYGYLFETRKREQLKDMFGQYVPEKHIDEMLKSSSSYALHGESREMSVLFADIRNFTQISETMQAAELVDMLNAFFTPMTEIIFNQQGTIDKYVGDLIMAFWGAPLFDKEHATHAIRAALEMQAKVKELQTLIAEHKWPEIRIGIGVNSGIMNVGDMGSQYRRNYTVLGDAVNLASRVEGLSKYYGVDIVVTESTAKNQTQFILQQLDRVRVKGKQQGVGIYHVIDFVTNLTPELKNELEQYQQALILYFQQQWQPAFEIMQELSKQFPHKKLYSIYIARLTEYLKTPPPSDWDGVYEHMSK